MADFATRSRLRCVKGYTVAAASPRRPVANRRELYRDPSTPFALPPESPTRLGHDCCDDVIKMAYDDRLVAWLSRRLADELENTRKSCQGPQRQRKSEDKASSITNDSSHHHHSQKSTLLMTLGGGARSSDNSASSTDQDQQQQQLLMPRSIGVDVETGDIFVADAGHDRVCRYTSCGVDLGSFGSSGTELGQFRQPTGVAVPAFGSTVLVADRLNRRIQVLSKCSSTSSSSSSTSSSPPATSRESSSQRNMEALTSFPTISDPWSVVADVDRNVIVGTTRGTVEIYSGVPSSPRHHQPPPLLHQFHVDGKTGITASRSGALRPIQVAVTSDKARTVIVLDQSIGTVAYVSYDGKMLFQFNPSHDRQKYRLNFSATSLAVDQIGQLILSDGLNRAVGLFDERGRIIRYVVEPRDPDTGPVQAVAVSPEGHFVGAEFSVNGSSDCVKVWKYRECACHRENKDAGSGKQENAEEKTGLDAD